MAKNGEQKQKKNSGEPTWSEVITTSNKQERKKTKTT